MEAEPAVKAGEGHPRRRALGFVIVFLACTFALLVGYRYAGGTRFMDWYLFQIARQTSAVLAVFGHSSSVENPDALQARRAEVRRELHAMTGTPASNDDSPLTSWEAWRYRALKGRTATRQAEETLSGLTAASWNPPSEPLERVKYLQARLERVQACLQPSGGSPEAVPSEVASGVRNASAALASVGPDGAGLPEVEAQVRSIEASVAGFMEQRVVRMAAQNRDDGPRVTYVARAGTERRIRELAERIKAVNGDASLDAGARQKRVAELQAEVAALRAETAPDKRKDSAFAFRVVADCGAIPSMTIFLAAVIAFPAPWRKRLIGAVLGVPVLYAINIVRLACLGALGAWKGPGPLFDFAHHYVWQGLYIVFVVAVWLLWVEFVVRGRPSWQKSAL